MKLYPIAKSDCMYGLFCFYENVAKTAGLKTTKDSRYDCRKICVSKPIQNCLWQYYIDCGHSDKEIATFFIQFGPKASLQGNEFIFEIEDGFVLEEE